MVISITPRGADGTTFYQVVKCDPDEMSNALKGFGLIRLGPSAEDSDPQVVTLSADGLACTCPDFPGLKAAGGCKHIRSLQILGIL